MQFTTFSHSPIGGLITADWARRLTRGIEELRPVARDGEHLEKTRYGVRIESATPITAETKYANFTPFMLRWHWINDEMTNGEWQVYLPIGCATFSCGGETECYLPINAVGKEKGSTDAYGWYKIDTPDPNKAIPAVFGPYAVKSWPVFVLFKPYPRMKVVASPDSDDNFEPAQWKVNIGTIAIAEYSNGGTKTIHLVTSSYSGGNMEQSWDDDDAFSIRYTLLNPTLPNSEIKAEVVNKNLMIGRYNFNDDIVSEISAEARSIWLKIAHAETSYLVSIEEDLTGAEAESTDEQTVVKIYDVEDRIVKRDLRSNIKELNLGLYTNPPETPDNAG